ncbi:rhomboid family intramembrane serine protease [Roseovarius sp. SCSIO 43702]|uniref:rhomboid family intramembrane serine protease n=1 Tax=Roseovarius sp. SCSIO 43702 TaxID=2823043 RepID=UPI001C739783|nr:rhomboid family intramembrane serine protease [Roseovarius sp. SCSIO 43702]QYX57330.1 rhomboid family intramembrane serine protease [Roseovarius sp. SCSIO 43702]
MFPIRDHNPSGSTPFVTWALIALNILVFLSYYPLARDDYALFRVYADFALVPGLVTEGYNLHGFLTSMFMHGGWMHLAGNMLFLWVFGDNMEDEMGHIPFLLFYLAAGFGAALAHYLSAPTAMVPMVGASGAIAGVMGGYLLLFPRARVDVLIILVIYVTVLPIPAWITLGLWFALQIFSGFGADPNLGGVAYWAHAGGFILGIVLTLPLFLRRGGPAFWMRTQGRPPHPEATYELTRSNIPTVRRRRK